MSDAAVESLTLLRNGEPDLEACAREPIHVPGHVQPRGALIACLDDGTITHASGNVDLLGLSTDGPLRIIGKNTREVLGAGIPRKIDEGLALRTGDSMSPLRFFAVRLKSFDGRVNIAAHDHGGYRLIEIEPAERESVVAPLDLVRVVLARLQQARALRELCDETARELRALLGMDRVMIYRFLHDGTGQVIAEAREPSLESLLDLRYPASDIPKQARELYKKNWVRLISDVESTPVPIFASPDHRAPLDLTYADLRSVSPVHIEYLKNMGVRASMSISIVVGGELWGLIACHHAGARVVGANVRAAAELVGQVFSLQIQTVESIEAYVTLRAGRLLLDRVISEFPVEGDLVENLGRRLDQLASFIPCEGVGVLVDGEYRSTGVSPLAHEARSLAAAIGHDTVGDIFVTHHLAELLPASESWSSGVCGVLAVPLSRTPGNWLFYFRRSVTQIIEWGGDPNKAASANAAGGISPRRSFATWRAEVRGQSLPWSSRERLLGETLRVYLLDIIVRFNDVIHEERRQAEQRRRLLTNELNHRVRGTLELIQSLVLHGYEGPESVQQFVRILEGRIKAIALAHDATSVVSGAEVRVLIERALALHPPSPGTFDIEGPTVRLDAKAYTVLALVIHELVSGAAGDQGALSTPGGHLSVSWFIDRDGRLIIAWDEKTPTAPPTRRGDGLGIAIIKRNIPHALGGEADYFTHEDGIRASFVIPARCVIEESERALAPADEGSPAALPRPKRQLATSRRPLEGYSILVVEDQITSALELEALLLDRGAQSVRIAGAVNVALDMIASEPPDVAILDFDLGEESAVPIANELAKQTVPFLFAATSADAQNIPAEHRDTPIIAKPYIAEDVVDHVKDAMLSRLIRAVLTKLT